MIPSTTRKILLLAVASSTVLLAATAMYSYHLQHSRPPQEAAVSKPLADDVEMVVKGYRYQESNDDFQLRITGAKSVRRGRRLLGLRSNVAKAIFFEGVEGTLKTAQRTLEFSAKDAEWSGDLNEPLILKSAVSLALDGRKLQQIERAKIYFKFKAVEVTGANRKIYKL